MMSIGIMYNSEPQVVGCVVAGRLWAHLVDALTVQLRRQGGQFRFAIRRPCGSSLAAACYVLMVQQPATSKSAPKCALHAAHTLVQSTAPLSELIDPPRLFDVLLIVVVESAAHPTFEPLHQFALHGFLVGRAESNE